MSVSLLREAEEAILNAWRKRSAEDNRSLGLAETAAIAALAVFEKQSWAGQDDWEILSRIIRHETGEPNEESGYVADAIIAYGFHRKPNCPAAQVKSDRGES